VRIERDWLERLIFGTAGARRFTQDSPVLPDVWLRYGEALSSGDPTVDLILTPHRRASAAQLATELLERLREDRSRLQQLGRPVRRSARLAYNLTSAVAQLSFNELLRVALPLSAWWREYVTGTAPGGGDPDFASRAVRAQLVAGLHDLTRPGASPEPIRQKSERRPRFPAPELIWFVRLTGVMLLCGRTADATIADDLARLDPDARPVDPAHGPDAALRRAFFDAAARAHEAVVDAFCDVMAGDMPEATAEPLLFLVSVNRKAKPTLTKSVLSVKADAARRLFDLSCSQLAWAILDSGIDAKHPAFRKRDAKGKPYAEAFEPAVAGGRRPERGTQRVNRTRVQATYDFTRVRDLLNPDLDEADANIERLEAELATADAASSQRLRDELAFWKQLVDQDPRAREQAARQLREGLLSGRTIQWSDIEDLIRVPHDDSYPVPRHDHGTHVAGILGADWRPDDRTDDDARATDEPLSGMCPDIQLYDFRVLDRDGDGDEFAVMAALQFVRYLNANRDVPLIHGINLSLAILHDIANYACGRTPVCDECERVVASGVVVVAAAGNEGYIQYTTPTGPTDGYRSISITDPANAETVISVGATHRHYPHTYGVSYFSSRGPTGDGRVKPDLVAPGEKILAPVPGGMQIKDGTSMAAPHVSGAAALLMSRHRELIGQPLVVKKVLCSTATDLGRERYFQGCGMLDVLRALQHL